MSHVVYETPRQTSSLSSLSRCCLAVGRGLRFGFHRQYSHGTSRRVLRPWAPMLPWPPSPRSPCRLTSVNAIDAKGDTVSLISGTPTVDFARFNGLQTHARHERRSRRHLHQRHRSPLGSATLGYLNTVSGSAPSHRHRTRDPAPHPRVNITLA